MNVRIPVIVSRGPSDHPAKRAFEEAVVEGLRRVHGLDVVVVANLYDLRPDGPTVSALRELHGDLIVLSWFYPRSAHWILHRFGISGCAGETELAEDDAQEHDGRQPVSADDEHRVVQQLDLPNRTIFCLDLRSSESPQPFLVEVQRLVSAATGQDVGGASPHEHAVRRIDETPARRWYPVIDFSRCTNCMECIDFCLFGVYGVDDTETILVEQPDNCRKGCPACSRVCPANAIMFPQHKTPAVAGATFELADTKIDLSQLFGGNGHPATAKNTALRERDEHLLIAGRKPVGADDGVRARAQKTSEPAQDDLDNLIDELDEMDL